MSPDSAQPPPDDAPRTVRSHPEPWTDVHASAPAPFSAYPFAGESPAPESGDARTADPDEAWLEPDPDEPPPTELWRETGDMLPWGSMLTLLAWGIVFAIMAARGELGLDGAFAARGASLPGRDALDVAWRLLASTFLHAGASHVLFNALTLLVFGQVVERVFSRWGYPIVYVLGGMTASWASLAWRLARAGAPAGMSVGGSGAVFALGGAILMGSWRLRKRLAVGRARALAAVTLFLALPGFAAGFQHPGTDNVAHSAGLLAGALLGAFVPMSPRLGGPPAPGPVRALGAVCVLAMLGALALVLRGG